MKIEFCSTGAVYLNPETEEEQAKIYKFWVENRGYSDEFKMKIVAKSEEPEEPDDYPQLYFYCEEQ